MKLCTLVSPSLLNLALVSLALLNGPVRAEDSDPVILEVQMNGQRTSEAPLGAVLMFEGENFHLCPGEENGAPTAKRCRHEDVQVRIGSQEAMLLAASPENVTFIVPQLGITPGPAVLRLEIAGKRPTSAPLTLFSPKEWEDKHEDERDQGCGPRFAPPEPAWDPTLREGPAARHFLMLDATVVRAPSGGYRIEVAGASAKLPDGFRLTLQACGPTGEAWDERKVLLDRGRFATALGPDRIEQPLGDWQVRAIFRLGQQSQVRARRFLSSLSPAERGDYERIQRSICVRVGSEAEIAEQRARLQAAIVGAGRQLWRATDGSWPLARAW